MNFTMTATENQFTIGSNTVKKTGPRKWDIGLEIHPKIFFDADGNLDPKTFQKEVTKQCEALVRYLRQEAFIDEGPYNFNVIVY